MTRLSMTKACFVGAVLLGVAAVPDATAADRDLDFDPVPGNPWWVEVYVDAPWHLEGVEARANGGAWHDMEKKDWGSWAASFRLGDEAVVEFRAYGSDGQQETSHKYLWPDATFLACPPAFAVNFENVRGNAWWVETEAHGNDRVESVEARVGGGQWHDLHPTDWGSWARSFHVPDGSLVQFRAQGEGVVLSGAYAWPDAERVEAPPELEAAFGPKAGNQWWVESYAIGEEPMAHVEVCKGDGQWYDMERRDWQAWTASFHVPDETELLFRATGESGRTNTSGAYVWPSAQPADADGEDWPRDGAYAHYHAEWDGPDTPAFDGHAIYALRDGLWHIACIGQNADGHAMFEHGHDAPPFGVVPVEPGEQVRVQGFHGCGLERENVEVQERRPRDTRQDSRQVTVDTWYAISPSEPREVYYETDVGIVVAYYDRTFDAASAELQDTNAPIEG